MENLKKLFKNKKVVTGVIVALLLLGSVGGYFIYDNNRKTEIMNKMSITFTDVKEIEYGTKDFDVKKELVKEVKNAELVDVPKVDTTKVGETKLVFKLKKDDVTKDIEHTIKVVDTKAPEISLETDSKELTVGDEYDIKTNVKSVTDVVDGDIHFIEDAKTINGKATEEYSKLKKEDITDDTKVADKKLDDFFIETTKGEDDKETTTLYLKNCYYIDGSVDTSKAGENKISVVAVDKNGIKTVKEFIINVKEKEVEKPVSSNGGGTSNGGGYASSGGKTSSGGGASNGGGSIQRGSKQDIINTALAQVGKPYQLNANGPNAFDCEGLIWYSYTQNGWNIPQHVSSGGTRLSSYEQLQPGDIIYLPTQSHVLLYLGNEQVLEAKNPAYGINVSTMAGISFYEQIYIRY